MNRFDMKARLNPAFKLVQELPVVIPLRDSARGVTRLRSAVLAGAPTDRAGPPDPSAIRSRVEVFNRAVAPPPQ